MLKIVLTGPESTGKTTLAKALATHYNTVWVPEFARSYLETIKRAYVESDLLTIAKGQIESEEDLLQTANKLLFCDTALLVLKVWSEVSYNRVDAWIEEQFHTRPYDLYLLCGTDTKWEYDPLREHPDGREMLYKIYLKHLSTYNLPFIELNGDLSARCQKAIHFINDLLVFQK